MPSKHTAPSALDALVRTNQQLLDANAQLLELIAAQAARIDYWERRAPERPLVTAEAQGQQPDVSSPDELADVASFDPSGDTAEINLSDDRRRKAEQLLDEAFTQIAEENRESAERMTRLREQGGAIE